MDVSRAAKLPCVMGAYVYTQKYKRKRERESKNKRYKKSKAPLTHGNLAAQPTSISSAANVH